MNTDEVMTDECYPKFMDVYFQYIERIGGGYEWASVTREHADLQIRMLLLKFSKEMIQKGRYDSSNVKVAMEEYDYTLPEGNELEMIDSYLATLQMSIDHNNKQLKNMTRQNKNESSLVAILTQINTINGVYLPYQSILLIEFIESYKLLNKKSTKNGRSN